MLPFLRAVAFLLWGGKVSLVLLDDPTPSSPVRQSQKDKPFCQVALYGTKACVDR